MVHDALSDSDFDLDPPPSAAGPAAPEAEAALPERIGARYEIETLLGRGGMAAVYLAKDSVTGARIALKQLSVLGPQSKQQEVAAWFEREFHTLAELSHPRVIAVYDYGVEQGRPYYTMELLDGGDLTELSPLPWREACRVMFDVCSSLALLHSRRLLHRDVSPRNVRCTADGHAKLIDFGAMAPMGYCRQAVGTPAFVAPEVVHRLALDARTDLYSAGATLYYALTGRLPHMARSFADAIMAWREKPLPPSALAPDTPAALDDLVLALLSLEPTQRPRTANEVMERLAALAGLPAGEPLSVTRAYLAAPALVGRESVLTQLRGRLESARAGHGSSVMISAEPGIGRSRLLDACVLEAKTAGARMLRANVRAAGSGEFALLQCLVDELLEGGQAVPEADAQRELLLAPLRLQLTAADGSRPRLNALGLSKPALQSALQALFEAGARRDLLAIVVDDAHEADRASIACLAALAQAAPERRLAIILTAERSALAQASGPLQVLAAASAPFSLAPLDARETEALISSVFGDVPNVSLLTERIYASAGGNPRDCMDQLQHLLSTGQISYARGQWTLPGVLTGLDLPSNAEGALVRRLGTLGGLARRLLEAHALASHSAFRREDYARIEAASDAALEAALSELVAEQMLESDGTTFVLARRAFGPVLSARLTAEERAARQRGLAHVYEHKQLDIVAAKHWLAAGEVERGLLRLIAFSKRTNDTSEAINESTLSVDEVAEVFEHGLAAAEGGEFLTRYELAELRHWLVMLGTNADDHYYHVAARAWFEEIARDSGLARWRELSDVNDAGERLTRALTHADQQHKATPEAARVYAPLAAIQFLVHFVAASVAVGVRTANGRLLASLPEILQPYAALSPLIHAIWQNSEATYQVSCLCQIEQARERYRSALTALSSAANDIPTRMVRTALICAMGLLEARIGLRSAASYVEQLEDERNGAALDAMYLRKVMRLSQGDFEGAEQYRRSAELLAVHANTRPMLEATLGVELGTHVLANDLTGVKQVRDRIQGLAKRYTGWQAFAHVAEGQFLRLCGNTSDATSEFERALQLCSYDPHDRTRLMMSWPSAVTAYIECLCEEGRAQEAEQCGENALATCRELGSAMTALSISRSLALAHAKRGEFALAAQRLDGVISDQQALGVEGLQLGASYETRTRIAIWADDWDQVSRFGQLTAAAYRHGTSSALAARYERLMNEVARPGITQLPSLTEVRSTSEDEHDDVGETEGWS